jgi:hypothetical protein
MSIFNEVSKNSGVHIGSIYSDITNNAIHINSNVTSKPLIMKNKTGKKRQQVLTTIAEENSKHSNDPIFLNIIEKPVKIPNISQINIDPYKLKLHIMEASNIFITCLGDSLFTTPINTIIMESCPIDDATKHRTDIESYTHGMVYSMFQGFKELKNFDKIVHEQQIPSFVCHLYELAYECARYECRNRLTYPIVKEHCGLNTEKINEYIDHELSNLVITDETTNEYYITLSGTILYENKDVIDVIKSKVNKELTGYRKTAKKMAFIKDDVKDTIDKEDPLDDADDKADAANPDAPPPDAASPPSDDPNAAPDDNSPPPDDSNPDDPNATPPDGDKPPNDEPKEPISEEFSAEIEDAATFAENNGHTFNTGGEKFSAIHDKHVSQFNACVKSGNLTGLHDIHNNVKSTLGRLSAISGKHDGKYNDLVDKYTSLSNNITFERNKKVRNGVKVAEESKSILDTLILNIGCRYHNKLQLEFAYDDPIKMLPGTQILDEACIYYTTLETFNTLKLFNIKNQAEFAMFDAFVKTSKNI